VGSIIKLNNQINRMRHAVQLEFILEVEQQFRKKKVPELRKISSRKEKC
jgi:hypothetical protein